MRRTPEEDRTSAGRRTATLRVSVASPSSARSSSSAIGKRKATRQADGVPPPLRVGERRRLPVALRIIKTPSGVARQRRKRRHRGGEARAPRQQVTRPRPHSRRLSRHRHNAPGCGRRRVPPARHTLLMLQSLACVRTRQAGRPPALRNTALTPSHSKVRSPPPCLRFGKAEDFTREAGNLSHRFAAQSGPAPRMKSAAYPYPQWRRTPRYARLSRRRDAPRCRAAVTRRAGASAREAASRQPCGAGQACRARHANRNPPAPHLTRGGRGGSASTDDAPFRARLTARQTARAFGTPYRLMPQPLTHARATRYAGRPSALRRARSRQHSAVRSPPPAYASGTAEGRASDVTGRLTSLRS